MNAAFNLDSIHARVSAVRERMARACERAGRDPSLVELLPVSKKQPLEAIDLAAKLGFTRFGENYVQEGLIKAEARNDLYFLLIGPLQRNKAKGALQCFDEILTLDRAELTMRLQLLAEESKRDQKVWIQVDLWNESTKVGGCSESELPKLLARLKESPRLRLQGLMAIPPPEDASAFSRMAQLRETLQQTLSQSLRLSMGMSHDLEAAIVAGSDQVRIGTAIFGERQ
jgi:PLP dependent protein